MLSRLSNSPLTQLHTAVLLFGGTALFSKLVPLPALDITFWRCAMAAIAIALIIRLSGQKLRLQATKDYGWAFVLGTLVCLHWVTYFASMQMSTVAIGVIAFFSYPVMVVLMEPYFTGNKLAPVDLLAAILVFSGIALMMPDFDLSNEITQGVLLGVLSAALFSVRNLLYKRHFSQYSGQQAMMYQSLVAVLILAPFVGEQHLEMAFDDWGLLAMLALLFTALPHSMFNAALSQLPAKTVGLINCLQPLYATALALIVLAEVPSVTTLLGGALVVSTAMYETQKTRKTRRK
ncbi:DMT family transporter [Paraferrimonas sedimenticola]|nr:DMT family transporter [Paraferrimonas sedimenticola]